jgi:hypothetical protein
MDPAIWQSRVTISVFKAKGGLVLRELERYYTHRIVHDKRGGVVNRKRMVEVRLVNAQLFPPS